MANRMFNQFQGTLEKGVVQLFAEISFDAGGVPTLVRGKGIASLSTGAAGVFELTLQDTYQRVLGLSGVFASAGLPVAPIVCGVIDDVANSAAPKVTVKTYTLAGTPDDPADETLLLTISLSNSTAL